MAARVEYPPTDQLVREVQENGFTSIYELADSNPEYKLGGLRYALNKRGQGDKEQVKAAIAANRTMQANPQEDGVNGAYNEDTVVPEDFGEPEEVEVVFEDEPEDEAGDLAVITSRDVPSNAVEVPEDADVIPGTSIIIEGGRAYLPPGTAFEDWENELKKLLGTFDAMPFVIGDVINWGEDNFGEDYAQIADATGYDVKSLWNMASVARKVPPENRVAALSWSHHQAVAVLPPAEQAKLLKEAQENKYSRDAVREITAERKRDLSPGKDSAGPSSQEEAEAPTPKIPCPGCGRTIKADKLDRSVFKRGTLQGV